jgi:hypothetical protein
MIRLRAGTLLAALTLSLAAWAPFEAQASPILQVNGSGILTGANGVTVGNSLYNVQFKDGSCNSLFNGCSNASFAFHNLTDANLASQSLLNQVLLDGASGLFDTHPELTSGCTLTTVCLIQTPYNFTSVVFFSDAGNWPTDAQDTFAGGASTMATNDLTTNTFTTYAVWTQIPEPSALALFGAGLLTLAGLGLRKRA